MLYQGSGIPMLCLASFSVFLRFSFACEGNLVRGFRASDVVVSGWVGVSLSGLPVW